MTDEEIQKWYSFLNAQTSGVDGISMADYGKGIKAYSEAFIEAASKIDEAWEIWWGGQPFSLLWENEKVACLIGNAYYW